MVRIQDKGVYLVDGQETLSLEGLPSIEEARKGTMAWGILQAHNQSTENGPLLLKFDSVSIPDNAYMKQLRSAREQTQLSLLTRNAIQYINLHAVEGVQLGTVAEKLSVSGNYLSARKMLMGISTRCAEWNYLFGAVLLRLAETEKALIYLSVAAHQNPDCLKYIRALNEAQGIRGGAMRRFARFARRG